MNSIDHPGQTDNRRIERIWVWILLLGLFGLIACQYTHAQEPPPEDGVRLVTYGPGEAYWESFGHNGIWIKNSSLQLNHVFNFGFFDFEQQAFFLRFLQGRMLYFTAAQPVEDEFAYYQQQNRSIRVQRLNLKPEQTRRLTDYLLNEIQLENRDYLYDYYWNNCSTRVRDALDLALGGAIRSVSEAVSSDQNQRDHTRRLTDSDYWFYLGLELGLGSPVDQPIKLWDAFFIPENLAEGLGQLSEQLTESGEPLILEDLSFFTSSTLTPPQTVSRSWPRYLLLAGTLAGLSILLVMFVPGLSFPVAARSWLVFSAVLGFVLTYLWVLTDHAVARNNMNILLFNPIWLLCGFGRRFSQKVACLVAGFGLIALLLACFTSIQYNADILAAFLLLNLLSAWILIREKS